MKAGRLKKKSSKYVIPIRDMTSTCHDLLKSDRDVNIAVAGFTGEGKSTFSTHFLNDYYAIQGKKWSFDLMTWSRKELLEWVTGKPKGKKGADGLIEGQLPEYSGLLPDELFMMFYKRNWYEDGQIGAIGTFNMCRDRHLLVVGNVPNFWDLDGAFQSRIRFYVFIPRRGVAWFFEQENNPFSVDPWNVTQNRNMFRKLKNPYLCPNFIAEVHFPDWKPSEKQAYYKIRNTKRVSAVTDALDEKRQKHGQVKQQRDRLIRMMFNLNDEWMKADRDACSRLGIKKLKYSEIANLLDLSLTAVRFIVLGER